MSENTAPIVTLQIVSSLSEVTDTNGEHCVDFTVLQLNDVYEAMPVDGGRLGGLARVATLRNQIEKENPNLITIMAGDFLAPSVISATIGDSGQHMIEALNAIKLTHATVGNHEFDIPEPDLIERIAESQFKWVVSNVHNGKGEPFSNTIKNDVIEYTNEYGAKVRVALIGVCLDLVKKPWLTYLDPIECARQQVAELDSKADVILAMTHLTIDQDKRLGAEVPRIDVLLGGHEHQAATAIVGEDSTPIFKADSNARSVCIHRFRYDTKLRITKLHTQLVPIDSTFVEEPQTAEIVKRWETITYATLRAQGINPDEVVGYTKEALDGYEAAVRSRPTNLTRLILDSCLKEVPIADAAIFSSGFIRIDGIIPPGDITSLDIVRIFPLNMKLSVLNLPGFLLKLLLTMADKAKGTGSFLAYANISCDASGTWQIKGEPMVDDRIYKVVSQETPNAMFSYPPFKGSGASKLFDTRDVRAILTDRLRRDRAHSEV